MDIEDMTAHPLAEELERLFCNDDRSTKTQGMSPWGRPRLGSDGQEEEHLSWQEPPASRSAQTPIPIPVPSPGGETSMARPTTDIMLQQVSSLAGRIGYTETISYLQWLERLRLREQQQHVAATAAAMSFATYPTTMSMATIPGSSSFLQTRSPPALLQPPTGAFTMAGPTSPAAPPSSPSLPPSDPESPAAVSSRPSRWVSAGLPPLSRSPPLTDDESFVPTTTAPKMTQMKLSPPISHNLTMSNTTPMVGNTMVINDWREFSREEMTLPRDDHATTKELLLEILRRNSTGAKGRGRQDYVCVFCRNNGEAKAIYTSHRLKDVNGAIQCPVLRIYTCPTCGATGDQAHTLKYCPKAKDTAARVPLCSPRKSNGKIRLTVHE